MKVDQLDFLIRVSHSQNLWIPVQVNHSLERRKVICRVGGANKGPKISSLRCEVETAQS